jgi:hypothetical protein
VVIAHALRHLGKPAPGELRHDDLGTGAFVGAGLKPARTTSLAELSSLAELCCKDVEDGGLYLAASV